MCAPPGIEFIRYLYFSFKTSVLKSAYTPISSPSREFRARLEEFIDASLNVLRYQPYLFRFRRWKLREVPRLFAWQTIRRWNPFYRSAMLAVVLGNPGQMISGTTVQ